MLLTYTTLQAFDTKSDGHSASRSQYLLDLMAKNKAATAAATVAGAAAGGAVAGPFGIAAGKVAWHLPAHHAYNLSAGDHSKYLIFCLNVLGTNRGPTEYNT